MSTLESDSVSRSDCQPWRDEETLRYYYYERQESLADIGRRLGVSDVSIGKWMEEYGLERRGAVESHMTDAPDTLTSESKLRELLVGQELTHEEVGERVGVSQSNVTKYAQLHGIESVHETSVTLTCAWCGESFDTGAWRGKGRENVFCDDTCQGQYYSEHRSGENHPAYKGGHARELYHAIANAYQDCCVMTVSNRYRKDNPECYKCGEVPDTYLDAHHIVPLMAGGTNEDYNLMSLCRSCHNTADAWIRKRVDRPILEIVDGER